MRPNRIRLTVAQQKLVEQWYYIPHDVARKLWPLGWIRVRVKNYEDLIEYGHYGLVLAARAFDPARGNQFSTYAYTTVRRQIYRLAEETRQIALPAYVLGEMAGARWSNMPVKRAVNVRAARRVLNARQEFPSDWDQTIPPRFDLACVEDTEEAKWYLDQLTPRQRMILEWRFGFGGAKATLKEVGDCLGLTRERVRQIEREAMTTLQDLAKTRQKN